MKKALDLLSVLLLSLFLLSCSDRKMTVQDNTFTLESDSEYFSGNVLTFSGAAGSAVVRVKHGPTAARWTVSSSLNDTWCSFKKNVDDLVVTVTANPYDEDRKARATVVMGDKSAELIVHQRVAVIGNDPVRLPDTEWDENETIYEEAR